MEEVTEISAAPTTCCQVCGGKAKYNHFGAICCNSCRAFFRRAVEKGNYLYFICLNNNLCETGAHVRKKCQKCRMDRCLRIGMQATISSSKAPNEHPETADDNTAADFSPELFFRHHEDELSQFLDLVDLLTFESLVIEYGEAYSHFILLTQDFRVYRAEVGYLQKICEAFGRNFLLIFSFYVKRMKEFSTISLFQKEDSIEYLHALMMAAETVEDSSNSHPSGYTIVWKNGAIITALANAIMEWNATAFWPKLFRVHVYFIGYILQLDLNELSIMLLIASFFCPEWTFRGQLLSSSDLLVNYMNAVLGPDNWHDLLNKLQNKLAHLLDIYIEGGITHESLIKC